MTVQMLDKFLMRILPRELVMEQDTDMTLFRVNHWDLKFRNHREKMKEFG